MTRLITVAIFLFVALTEIFPHVPYIQAAIDENSRSISVRSNPSLPFIAERTHNNQIIVAASKKPINCLKAIIQLPGLGIIFNHFGNIESNKYGDAIPSASAVKTVMVIIAGCVSV